MTPRPNPCWVALALSTTLTECSTEGLLRAANAVRHCGRHVLADACMDELRRRGRAS